MGYALCFIGPLRFINWNRNEILKFRRFWLDVSNFKFWNFDIYFFSEDFWIDIT